MKNWKTTGTGVLAFLPMLLHAIFPKIVTIETAATVTSFLTSLGLFAAKDHNK